MSKYWPDTDRKGAPVAPGDWVSCPAYPRGTIRGHLEICTKASIVSPDGSRAQALVIVTENGVRYNPTSKILLLKNKG